MIGSFKNPISAAPITIVGPIVEFYDYDGTLLKTETIVSGGTATAPTPPVLAGLTFVEWNNPLTNITADTKIGAIRDTSDGKTRIIVEVNSATGLQPTMYLNSSTASIVTIDWGDGNTQTTASNTSHTVLKTTAYATAGEYIIKVSSTVATNLGQGGSIPIFEDGAYSKIVKEVNFGSTSNMKIVRDSFGSYMSLRKLSFSYNIFTNSTSSTSMFASCAFDMVVRPNIAIALNNVASAFQSNWLMDFIPSPAFTVVPSSFFSGCFGITTINQILKNVTTVGDNSMRDWCQHIPLIIPTNVTSIQATAFTGNSPGGRTSITLKGNTTITTNFFSGSYTVEKIIVENMASIPASAFSSAICCLEIDLPSNLTAIGGTAFSSLQRCQKITVRATTPPTITSNTFSNINIICKFFVPAGSVSAYKTATNRVAYANQIFAI